jgi:hypothetical protein
MDIPVISGVESQKVIKSETGLERVVMQVVSSNLGKEKRIVGTD